VTYAESVERLLRPVITWLAEGGDTEQMTLQYWSTRHDLMAGGEMFWGLGDDHLSDIDLAMDCYHPHAIRNEFDIDESELRRRVSEAIAALRALGVIE
jgi:hypothetical protein